MSKTGQICRSLGEVNVTSETLGEVRRTLSVRFAQGEFIPHGVFANP